mmetsp:Transcript_56826/g.176777  ORF Transcript_56826/g.176777 Transcript_56826/m.176777 type:complete len:278 (+) Transcript_56826:3-836(+)
MMAGSLQPPPTPAAATAPEKVKPPAKTGPLFLYFTDVAEEDMSRITAAATKAEVKQLLKRCMRIDQAEGFRTEILADMHYHNYSFCVGHSFTAVKTSTFLSIMRLVLEEAVGSRLTASEAFEVFKDWLLRHSVERPPWSVGVFTFDDVKAVMDYVHNTFFRHYRLYMYVYMTRCDLGITMDGAHSFIAIPPPRPLRMWLENEVTPRDQPELAHLYGPTETELAEERERERQAAGGQAEDRAAIIKRKVDAGVEKLMQRFEERIQEQDSKFQAMMDRK